jgi:hypothetical protein
MTWVLLAVTVGITPAAARRRSQSFAIGDGGIGNVHHDFFFFFPRARDLSVQRFRNSGSRRGPSVEGGKVGKQVCESSQLTVGLATRVLESAWRAGAGRYWQQLEALGSEHGTPGCCRAPPNRWQSGLRAGGARSGPGAGAPSADCDGRAWPWLWCAEPWLGRSRALFTGVGAAVGGASCCCGRGIAATTCGTASVTCGLRAATAFDGGDVFGELLRVTAG